MERGGERGAAGEGAVGSGTPFPVGSSVVEDIAENAEARGDLKTLGEGEPGIALAVDANI